MTDAEKKSVEMKLLDRTAFVRADTADAEARTVEVVWTTGAGVPRYVRGVGDAIEELEVSAEAIRLDRLNNGAPLLNAHSRWGLGDVIGVVESAWINGNEGHALVRFSEREQVDDIWRDVLGGILRNISVGYRVYRYEVVEEDGEATRVIAKDWEPTEISIVPIGADDKAGFRAAENENPCTLERAEPAQPLKESKMENEAIEQPGTAPVESVRAPEVTPAPAPVDTEALKREAAAAERQRISDIRDIGTKLRIDDATVKAAIDGGSSLDQARAAFIDHFSAEDDASGETSARILQDETDTRRTLATNALENRINPAVELSDGARQFRGMSLLELGKDLLIARGVNVRGMTKMEVAGEMLGRGFHSTSDFPYILANVASKTLRQAYQAAPQTFQPIARRVTLPDFKTVSRVQLGESPALVKKLEGAEYKRGTIGEGREQYNLVTYGRAIDFTREMIINDDLNAFDRVLQGFGQSAANLESDIVWGLITGNGNLSDGAAIFSGSSLLSAAAISIASLSAAKAAMRKQKGLDGETVLNLEPAYLAVPAELEGVAMQYMQATAFVTDPEKQNIHANTMGLIVEPRLASLSGGSADDWYTFAAPGLIDTIEYGYLDGEEGVVLETQDNFNTDGVSMKARLDFAAAVIDRRGMNKNPGS